jgi:hypothetical protein
LFAAGAGVLIFEAVSIGLDETSSADAMTPVRWALLAVVLGAMIATYVVHLTVAARWARQGTIPRLRRSLATARVRS